MKHYFFNFLEDKKNIWDNPYKLELGMIGGIMFAEWLDKNVDAKESIRTIRL